MIPLVAVLEALVSYRCRFVVVGSTAGWLLGGLGDPGDVDVVVRDSEEDRRRTVVALAAVGGWMCTTAGPRPIETLRALPSRSWRVMTAYAPVDVVFRFPDGTGYAEHRAAGVEAVMAGNARVMCRRTLMSP